MAADGGAFYTAARPMTSSVARQGPKTTALSRPETFPPGRLGALALMGAATGGVPLPFVPAKMLATVRGAVVHDVVSRNGLGITRDARKVLADLDATAPHKAKLLGLAEFVTGRVLARLGPARLLSPALSALETYALGHLLDRYLNHVRVANTVRIQVTEAYRVRTMIDRAIIRVIAPDLQVAAEQRADGAPKDDQREDLTRVLDGLLLGAASLPGYIVRRLDAAFDAVVAETPDAGEA